MTRFSKYSGCGNDFILIDNRENMFSAASVSQLCARHTGIGADGVILLENSSKADYLVRIFNSDGSEAEMCGNGMRCYGKFLEELNLKTSAVIEAKERHILVEVVENGVKIGMGTPTDMAWDLSIDNLSLHYMNTGVPHTIQFVSDINRIDLLTLGPKIRFHPRFQPKGTNFNVAEVHEKKVSMRTYERGVEGETLACGTGATAVAIAASKKYGISSPVAVETRSGEMLEIAFQWKDGVPTEVTATGPAIQIFRGEIAI